MSNIEDPLGLSEMTAKECILCGFKDKQEDIIETGNGMCHKECLDEEQDKHIEEVSGDNNEQLL